MSECEVQAEGCPEKSTIFLRVGPIGRGRGPGMLACLHCWRQMTLGAKAEPPRAPVVVAQVRTKKRRAERDDDASGFLRKFV